MLEVSTPWRDFLTVVAFCSGISMSQTISCNFLVLKKSKGTNKESNKKFCYSYEHMQTMKVNSTNLLQVSLCRSV